MRRALQAVFAALSASCLAAQGPEPEAGLIALRQACLDCGTTGVVLNVAAHPDDESSRTNTVLRRKHGLRVVTVYSTYGDGGQNAIGREIGPELAHLRVRETLRAAATSDVEVRWLGMTDFGFSKTLDETLKVWDGERLKAALRKVVDEVGPDIVLTNHTIDTGHGHHRASFWAIQEVLKERQAAGGHVPPLYSRAKLEETQWTVDPAELDPVRGETWARLAHRAWTQHVTQGPWGPHNPLQVGKDHWKVIFPPGVAKAAAAAPLGFVRPFPGVPEAALRAEAGREALQTAAVAALTATRAALRAAWAEGPRGDRELLDRLIVRERRLQKVLLALAGVGIESWLESDELASGARGKLLVVVHGSERLSDLQIRCGDVQAEPAQVPVRGTPFDGMAALPAGATVPAVSPANEAPSPPAPPSASTPAPPPGPQNRFQVAFTADGDAEAAESAALVPAWVTLDVTCTLDGTPIHVHPKHWYTPVPPVELRWDREAVLVPRGQKVERILGASVTSRREHGLHQAIRLGMGFGVKAEAIPGRLSLSPERPEARLLVRAAIDSTELTGPADLKIEVGGQRAVIRLIPIDVTVPQGLAVALVRGPDDTVERALGDLGVPYVAFDRDTLAVAKLDEFACLLLDMRVYHHRPDLAEHRDRILQFCSSGGRVVAFYHKPGEWNEKAGRPWLCPFPLTVGDARITEEDAAVTFLVPEHRLFMHPHRIDQVDFAGWVQERGLNFPSKWDPAWTPLLEFKDSADEKPSQGALLYTQYGRGDYVYCSLALYRQLRAGNAGAARLLINLLAR